jgi:hypothetical protein
MKSLVALILVSICCGVGASLTARHSQRAEFATIVVDRFANTSATTQSPEFIQAFCDGMRDELSSLNVAGQVVEQGVTVNPADAANALVVEGRFTGYTKGDLIATDKLTVEIDVYRAGDHTLVKSFTHSVAYKSIPINSDKKLGTYAGAQISRFVEPSL